MSDFDDMFNDAELVRAFNGAGITTTPLPDSIMAKALRVVAQYAIAKYIASETPATQRIADSLEKIAAIFAPTVLVSTPQDPDIPHEPGQVTIVPLDDLLNSQVLPQHS